MDDPAAVAALGACDLFSHLDEEALSRVARTMRRRRYRKGEVLFHQGDLGDNLHVLVSGSVKIALASEEGEEAILVTLRPYRTFGELSLLDGGPRSASAVALEPTETWSLPRPALLALAGEDPAIRDALLRSIAGVLRRVTGQVEELHFLDMAGRLAARLAALAREAEPDAASVRLPWPYTQSDVAAMIGGTRQSVNRLLADLVDEGLIAFERDTLVVPDVEALARASGR
jgi:CRP-like cAMP-binding protein